MAPTVHGHPKKLHYFGSSSVVYSSTQVPWCLGVFIFSDFLNARRLLGTAYAQEDIAPTFAADSTSRVLVLLEKTGTVSPCNTSSTGLDMFEPQRELSGNHSRLNAGKMRTVCATA